MQERCKKGVTESRMRETKQSKEIDNRMDGGIMEVNKCICKEGKKRNCKNNVQWGVSR